MATKRRIKRIATAVIIASVAWFSSNAARAERCSNRTTEGAYTVVGDGFLSTGPNTPLVPAKLLSLVTADANGNYSGVGTLSFGGQIFTQEVTGTQQLGASCTGTITYKQTLGGHPGPDLHFTFIISEGGNRIDGLSVDPGTVFSAVLRRVANSSHESADVEILER